VPAVDLRTLEARSKLLSHLRSFLKGRGLLEVETPLLWSTAIPERHIHLFSLVVGGRRFFLQASPELFLKILLARGMGDLFQLAKVFRRSEIGRWHNPEFTLLEWYRVGWSLEALIGEVVELVQQVLGPLPVSRLSYGALFEKAVGLPWQAPLERLAKRAYEFGLPEAAQICRDRADWLDFLFANLVQPLLPDGIAVVEDYPAPLAALARLKRPDTAARFELFIDRVELANGYDELNDGKELRKRLEAAREELLRKGEVVPPLDETLIELTDRLPPCCGVALGVDRLLALKLGRRSIREVIPFPWPEGSPAGAP